MEMGLIDGGLEDLEINQGEIIAYCDFVDFKNMQLKLEEMNIPIINSELQRIPKNKKKISTEESKKVLQLLDLLEENDDVQQVFHNMELSKEILNEMNN